MTREHYKEIFETTLWYLLESEELLKTRSIQEICDRAKEVAEFSEKLFDSKTFSKEWEQ